MTPNLFNEFTDAGPEAKLELIESKLIVGNTLVGTDINFIEADSKYATQAQQQSISQFLAEI